MLINSTPNKPVQRTKKPCIILDNHHEKQAVITGKVWNAFEEYRGEQVRRDDFELVTFKPYTT